MVIDVPVTARLTAWMPMTGSVVVAVRVTTVVPDSEPVLELIDRLIRGKSLLIIAIAWLIVAPKSKSDERLPMVKIAVSVDSTNVSLNTVKVTVPTLESVGIVIVLLLRI